ncbi:MAG: sulfite exporter TauE/SafE family protein [Bacteroidales bacterium]|nr:sulfite exporter TauE/SafE family protein [Bacteroidales bacterium]
MVFITALTLGLLGSFHCAGMCGPIAIALPLGQGSWFRRISGGLGYNLGRTITYAILGAIFGFIGQGLELAGFHRWVSITMGAVMVVAGLFPSLIKGGSFIEKTSGKFVSKLQTALSKLFRNGSIPSLFWVGILNGFLPCGLVYMALAGALASGSFINGVLFMTIFGLGTIPVMLAISLVGNLISNSFRQKINSIIPYLIVTIGILFILRGLNLGIPFISPPEKKLHLKEHIERVEKLESNVVEVKGACCQ